MAIENELYDIEEGFWLAAINCLQSFTARFLF